MAHSASWRSAIAAGWVPMTSMHAIVVSRFGGPEVLEPAQVELPVLASTEVLVRVAYAGINPVDIKTRRGAGVSRWLGHPPFVLGWDVAGTVEGLGYGVSRFTLGDRVFGMIRFPRQAGAYAQFVTAPSLQFSPIPPDVELLTAAAVPLVALTAWQSLVDTGLLEPNARVLVLGAGGAVGRAVVDLANMHGSKTLAIVRRSGDTGHTLPATYVKVAPEAPSVGEVIAVLGLVDVLVDLVGDQTSLSRLVPAIAPGGSLVAIADGVDAPVAEQARMAGVRVIEPLVEPDGRSLEELSRLLSLGVLHIAVDDVLPLTRAPTAHRRVEAGGLHGKLLLTCAHTGTST